MTGLSDNLCECGCGQRTRYSTSTGKPNRFVRDHQQSITVNARQVDPVTRFWANVRPADNGCWLWHGSTDPKGYGRLSVRGRKTGTHRFSYELHFGPIPDGLFVCHACDTPACVNPGHLFLGTHQDNMADRDRKGRGYDRNGTRNGRAKLTEKQVRAIRAGYADGVPQVRLAECYGVTRQVVWGIVHDKIWRAVA